MKQQVDLFQNLTQFLRYFSTTIPLQLYGKGRIAGGNIDIFVPKFYNKTQMKPFSVYEMFQIMKQR